ncbi:MAG: TolC family protein [Thiomonas sp.]
MSAPRDAMQHGFMPVFCCSTARHCRLPALALATLLAGCAAPPPQQPGVTPRSSAQALLQRSLRDPELARFIATQTGAPQAPTPVWTLRTLSLAALYFHPDLQVGRAGMELAEADLQIAQQRPNPSLQLGLKYGSAAALAAPSPWTVGAAIGLLLQSRAQRAAHVARAQAGVRAARYMLDAVRWQVRARVQRAWIGLWAARRRLRLQQDTVNTARTLQRHIAARAQAGMDAPLAAALAQRATQQAAMRLGQDRAAQRAARIALAAAVGVPAAALQRVRLDFSAMDAAPPGVDQATLARLVHAALQHRDDVRAAWQRVRAARAALQQAQAARDGGPPLLAPGAERDQGVDRLTLGLRLPLPVRNQHQGQIAQARARLARRIAQLAQVQAQALTRVEQAAAALHAAAAQERRSARRVAVDRALFCAALGARARGLVGPLQPLRARLHLLSAQRAQLQARAAQWQALADLQSALQQPFLRTAKAASTVVLGRQQTAAATALPEITGVLRVPGLGEGW